MSILAPIIAAFTFANGAHYWHHQLKPFTSRQERIQAIKEQLADNPFVAHWDDEKHILNSRFLGIKNYFFFTPSDSDVDFSVSLGAFPIRQNDDDSENILTLPSIFLASANRYILKKLCDQHAVVLGHEGVHIAQGIERILDEPENRRFFESDADLKGLNATIESRHLTAHQKLNAITKRKSMLLNYRKKIMGKQEPSAYPTCSERIELNNQFIPHAQIEIINDIIRDEIAWQ